MVVRSVSLRSRSANGEPLMVIRDDWDTARIPRVNQVAGRLRRDGALIVHAPAGCMDFYDGTAARERARRAPPVRSPVPVDWHDWDESRESPLPAALADDTPCSCEPGEPCTEGGPPYPWTQQISSIEISAIDAITDDGAELLALLEEREIEDVVVAGVHLNRCVLGRP